MLKGFAHRQTPVAAQRQATPHVPVLLRQHQTFRVRCHALKPATKDTLELDREEAQDTLKLVDREEVEGEKEEAKGEAKWRFPVFPDVGSYASSLVSGLLQRNEPEEASIPAEEVLQEASNKEKEMQDKAAPADISQFLSPVPVWELKHIRKLCHLCAISYKLPTVTQRALKRKHGLDLVMASWLCNTDAKALLEDVTETPDEVAAEGDGMAVTLTEIRSHYKPPAEGSSKNPPTPPSLIPTLSPPSLLSNIVPVPNNGGAGLSSASSSGSDSEDEDDVFDVPHASPATSTIYSSSASSSSTSLAPPSQQQQRKRLSPAELVAAKLAEAAAAASSFAASLPIASSRGKGGTNSTQGSPNVDSSTNSSSMYGNVSGMSEASSDAERTRQQKQQQRAVLRTAAEMAVNGARSTPPPSTQQQQQQQQQGGRAAGSTTATANSSASKAPWALPTSPSKSTTSSSTSPAPAAATADAEEGRALCPSEWFVCDDVANHTRIFVIQGSDTLDHWKLNITFDPVVFEDPALGVKVHRGVYEAAQVLYKRFLPLVYEAIESSPCTKICFTGHSVGGSLGTLLALMLRYRGVLPLDRLATLYTFGAPAVFCECGSEGEGCCEEAAAMEAGSPKPPLPSASRDQALNVATSHMSGQGNQSDGLEMNREGGTLTDSCCGGCCQEHGDGSKGLLAMLGLPNSLVRNVIMSRDIVPRAFACDYSLVADILKGWGPSFKDHGCLAREGRKHLYYFIGHMMVLQPDGGFHWFVGNNEPDHPMLPPGPNMLLVGSPTLNGLQQNQKSREPSSSSSSSNRSQTEGKDRNGAPRLGGIGPSSSSSSSSSGGSMLGRSHEENMAIKAGSTTTTTTITARGDSDAVLGAHTVRHTGGATQGSSAALSADAKHAGARNGESEGASPSPSPSPSPGPSRSGSPTSKASRGNASRSSASRSESPRGSRSSSPSSMLPGFSMPQLPLPSLRPLSLPTSNSPAAPAPAVAPMVVAEQKRVQQQQQQALVRSHTDAVAALMDNPHPLDILADPGAYLSSGSISRYHNPDNYTAALGRLIFLKRKHEGRFPSWLFKTYSRMLRMEAELEARSWEGRGQDLLEQQHPYVSAWDGTEMDIENHEAAARRPLEVHHW